MDKENVVHTYVQWNVPQALKKGNLAIWDLEGIMLSGLKQTKKGKHRKYCIISLLCGIFKKNKDTKNRLVFARDGELGEGLK